MESFYAGMGLGFLFHAGANYSRNWPPHSRPLLLIPTMLLVGFSVSTIDFLRRRKLEHILQNEDRALNAFHLRTSTNTPFDSYINSKYMADNISAQRKDLQMYMKDRLMMKTITNKYRVDLGRAMLACVRKCVDLQKGDTLTEKEMDCMDEQLEYFKGKLILPKK